MNAFMSPSSVTAFILYNSDINVLSILPLNLVRYLLSTLLYLNRYKFLDK